MMAHWLSSTWPAIGNHLWQSTLFVVAAGLLTLVIRKNQARTRYWLWLAASLKFLLPFSLLAALGSSVVSSGGAVKSTGQISGQWYMAMNEMGQPFTHPVATSNPKSLFTGAFPATIQFLFTMLAAIWLVGMIVVLSVWFLRWRQLRMMMREARLLQAERELSTLRRMERMAGIRRPIEMLLSRASLEPGIAGIFRPVLLWPEGISEHLEDSHLEAIIAHEVWHVRRHDNLAGALHMMVQALFWFHPLVWWLGARLVEERERACDEHVLELGSERHIYAESILRTCRFCAGFPLVCVSGVTGADLKRRIAHIMTARAARELNFSRKLVLAATAWTTLATPVILGVLSPKPARSAGPAESPSYVKLAVETQASAAPAVPVAQAAAAKTKKCTKSLAAGRTAASTKSSAAKAL